MLEFIAVNLSTIVVGVVVAVLIVAVAVKLIRDKRRGKCSCCNGCAGCPSSGMCHPE